MWTHTGLYIIDQPFMRKLSGSMIFEAETPVLRYCRQFELFGGKGPRA